MIHRSRHATARDVAELAGVSSAVVSYVLSGRRGGKDRISDETRQRVMAAVVELGYVPNQAARSLRRAKTERICLVLPRLGAPYNDVLAQTLQEAAEANGYTLIIAVSGNAAQEALVLDQLRRQMADGVIFHERYLAEDTDIASLQGLAQAGTPVVVLSETLVRPEFDIFRTTHLEGCYEAVDYLISKGHRRIGFIGHLTNMGDQSRLHPYRLALMQHGIELDDELIRGGATTREKSYRSALELLRLEDRPTALFVTADLGATGALWAARDAGLRVPDDVAIIGVGNIPESLSTQPPLTTVGPDPLEFHAVAEMLFSRLEGTYAGEGRIHTQKWGLILRGSA